MQNVFSRGTLIENLQKKNQLRNINQQPLLSPLDRW